MKKYIILLIIIITGSAIYFSFDRSGADKMKNKGGVTMTDNSSNLDEIGKEITTASGLRYLYHNQHVCPAGWRRLSVTKIKSSWNHHIFFNYSTNLFIHVVHLLILSIYSVIPFHPFGPFIPFCPIILSLYSFIQ